MLRKATSIVLLSTALLGWSCSSSTDKTDTGGVRLVISDFDGLPVRVDASVARAEGGVRIESLTIQNLALKPGGTTSDLMNVELEGLEFTYTRGDTGTRVPPPLVFYTFGMIPVNGTTTIEGAPCMLTDQIATVPLSDLVTFGRDTQTGSSVVRLQVGVRAFGKTISGTRVDSAPASFTVDVVP